MDEIDINVLKLIKKKLCHADISLLKPVDISDANLFYQEDFMEELVKIEQILSEKNFNRYISRFSKTSRMKGLTFLFYGSPGCGKTEFALQLAKRTQRPILKIQVTDFMSKWVGESEANLKRIFNDYRMLVEQSKIQPILLLNECDQMIGKRVNISDSVDQMSNALQNILLEEMENFSGILIGTTNQTANMDSAFERRWLYKLEFIPPNEKIQVKIWQSFLPRLPENIALELSSRFNLTPGEISNVAKRFEIEQLIVKKSAVLETLLRLWAVNWIPQIKSATKHYPQRICLYNY
jgi:SpoVK/Ycf46/Vps4 family AAA+-type ATPase